MNITAPSFTVICALIAYIFFLLGIDALNQSNLRETVPPTAMGLFQNFLALSFCYSSTYALALRPKLKISIDKYLVWISFVILPLLFSGIAGESFRWYFPVYWLINMFSLLFHFLPAMKSFFSESYTYYVSIAIAFIPLICYRSSGKPSDLYILIFFINFSINFMLDLAASPVEKFGLLFHVLVISTMLLIDRKTINYSPAVVIPAGILTSSGWAAISGGVQEWPPETILAAVRVMRDHGKAVEFVIGIGGAVLFRYLFGTTSSDDMVAFLYIAVAWLGNLGMLMGYRDLGVFNFLVGNVVVGFAVLMVGDWRSWAACGGCVLLCFLREKMESAGDEEEGALGILQERSRTEECSHLIQIQA